MSARRLTGTPHGKVARHGLRALLTGSVAAAALLGVGSAHAAPPTQGTTTATLTSDVVVSARPAGKSLLITEEQATSVLNGAFTGSSAFTIGGVLHADGSGMFQGRGTFTGVVAGCGPVTLGFVLEFRVSTAGAITGRAGSIAGSPVTYQSTLEGSLFSPTFVEQSTYRCHT